MATNHLYRLLFVIPAASRVSFNTWCKANLNGGTGGDWFGDLGLSASGNLPATHYWASVGLTGAEAQTAVQRLCTVSGVPIAADWATRNRDEKIQWVRDNAAAILAGAGNLYVRPMPNDGTWDSTEEILTTRGLKVIQPVIP